MIFQSVSQIIQRIHLASLIKESYIPHPRFSAQYGGGLSPSTTRLAVLLMLVASSLAQVPLGLLIGGPGQGLSWVLLLRKLYLEVLKTLSAL